MSAEYEAMLAQVTRAVDMTSPTYDAEVMDAARVLYDRLRVAARNGEQWASDALYDAGRLGLEAMLEHRRADQP